MAQTQALIASLKAAYVASKGKSATRTQWQKARVNDIGGSDWNTFINSLGLNKDGSLSAAKITSAVAALGAVAEQPPPVADPEPAPVPTPDPATTPISQPPVVETPVASPPAPPVVSQPDAPISPLRALFNEDKITQADGTVLNVQNSGRPGTTMTDGKGYYLFDLKDSTDQRPSEKRPKGTKRRSEISGLVIASPAEDEVQEFRGQFRFAAQPFADNMQWVAAQRHPGDDKGHPEIAFRFEKGGYIVLSTSSAVDGDSLDTKTKRLLAPGIWTDILLRDIGGHRAELWINGEMWAGVDTQVGYKAANTPYWKWGCYNSQGSNEHTTFEWRNLTLNGKPVGV